MRQRGTVTLLLAFAVLTLSTVAVYALHRNLLREWAMEGQALQGARAGLAADTALAWFLAEWTTPEPEARGQGWAETRLAVPPGVLAGAAPAPLVVDGEVRVRFLGPLPTSLDPEGTLEAWRVTVRGRLQVPGAGRGGNYQQTRQAYVVTARGQAGARPVLRAWRVVR